MSNNSDNSLDSRHPNNSRFTPMALNIQYNYLWFVTHPLYS